MRGRPVIAVIPARHRATRFPGKPLVLIAGVPMVVRVAERVRRARRIDDVCVATDDARIAEVVTAAGFEAIMTDPGCPSGTDRVASAVEARGGPAPGWVINVQGDEPLIDPDDLDRLVEAAHLHPTAIVTLARPSADARELDDPNCVKVAVDVGGRALTFSRSPTRHPGPLLVHIGVYGYPTSVLCRFVQATPTTRERSERLEQLRAFELGIPMFVTIGQSDCPTIGVDVPEDVGRVEAALRGSAHRRGTI